MATLQNADADRAKQLAAVQAQLADLANGHVNVSGEIPATVTIGGQQ